MTYSTHDQNDVSLDIIIEEGSEESCIALVVGWNHRQHILKGKIPIVQINYYFHSIEKTLEWNPSDVNTTRD